MDDTVCRLSKKRIKQSSNENEALAYIGLKIMFDKIKLFENKKLKEQIFINFNISNLFFELAGNFNASKSEKTNILNGINCLIKNNVVKCIDSDDNYNYCLECSNLFINTKFEKEPFITINQSEIQNIFNIKHKTTKQRFSLLVFSVGLFGTFNSNDKCGYTSFRNMPKITNISCSKTCQNYFKLLEENNIIYVRHSTDAKRNEDGTYMNLPNVYGRPCDKEAIDYKYAKNVEEQSHNFTIVMDAKEKSNLTRRYNSFKSGKFNGNVEELIADCIKLNNLPFIDMDVDRQKDMSVFDVELVSKIENKLGLKSKGKLKSKGESRENIIKESKEERVKESKENSEEELEKLRIQKENAKKALYVFERYRCKSNNKSLEVSV